MKAHLTIAYAVVAAEFAADIILHYRRTGRVGEADMLAKKIDKRGCHVVIRDGKRKLGLGLRSSA